MARGNIEKNLILNKNLTQAPILPIRILLSKNKKCKQWQETDTIKFCVILPTTSWNWKRNRKFKKWHHNTITPMESQTSSS